MRGNKKRKKTAGSEASRDRRDASWGLGGDLAFFLENSCIFAKHTQNPSLKNVGRLCYFYATNNCGCKKIFQNKVGVFHEVFPSFYTKQFFGIRELLKRMAICRNVATLTDRLPTTCNPYDIYIYTHIYIYIAFVGNIVKWIEMIDDLNDVSWSTQEKPPNTRPAHILWTSKWLRTWCGNRLWMHDRQCLRSCSDDGSPLGVSNWNNMTMRFDAWAFFLNFTDF